MKRLRNYACQFVAVSLVGCYYDDFDISDKAQSSEVTETSISDQCEKLAQVSLVPAKCGQQALVNPGLDDVVCEDQSPYVEAVGWGSHTPVENFHVIYNDMFLARGGSWFAYLGGYYGATDSLWQTVSLPETFTGATLRFYLRVEPREKPATEPLDFLYVDLLDNSGYIAMRLVTLSDHDYQVNENEPSGYGYRRIEVDVPRLGLAGMTVTLRFMILEDFRNGVEDFSNFQVDDITLTLDPCGS